MGEGDEACHPQGFEGEVDISSTPTTRWQPFAVDSLWLLRAGATWPARVYHIVSVVIRASTGLTRDHAPLPGSRTMALVIASSLTAISSTLLSQLNLHEFSHVYVPNCHNNFVQSLLSLFRKIIGNFYEVLIKNNNVERGKNVPPTSKGRGGVARE